MRKLLIPKSVIILARDRARADVSTLEERREAYSDAVYTLREFTIDQESPETPRRFVDAQERRRTAPSDHKSQSEHDWAYAKRALARGDDPEVVISRIADYRADGKDDPNLRFQLCLDNSLVRM